jgi:hypothetical protein
MKQVLKNTYRSIRTHLSNLNRGMHSRLFYWSELPRTVRYMAETGAGTQECLEQGCLPMQVHFYSPVPDIKDLRDRGVFCRKSKLSGIDLRVPQQLALLAELGAEYGAECAWPHEPTGDPHQFHTSWSGFSFGCAAALHSVIRKHKPRRVIEIGSGGSSRVISAALLRNYRDTGKKPNYTVIDPYPTEITRTLPGLTCLEQDRVEATPTDLFEDLDHNDLLFVDSGHTVRIGGDVNYLLLDIVPALRPGVIVHVHDIPMPYEYAEVYYTNSKFRMLWTESYLLQAFLCHNHAFEVLLAMNFLMCDKAEEFRGAWPQFQPAIHGVSHSFWFRRKPEDKSNQESLNLEAPT